MAELRQELESIGSTLSETTTDWKKRLEALKRIKELLTAGAASHSNFVQLAKDNLRDSLNSQLRDLRSAIVRETCLCIQQFCEKCQPYQWEAMSDWWLTALFKCSFVTIAAVAEASNATLRFIVQNGRLSSRAACCIMQHTQNKHSVCRTHAYDCILLMLLVHSYPFLEKHAEGIDAVLQAGFSDGVPEVRHASRLAWWVYKEHFPDRADRLYTKSEPVVQKNIADDAEAYKALPRPDPLPPSTTTPSSKSSTPASRRIPAAGSAARADAASGTPSSSNKQVVSAKKPEGGQKPAVIVPTDAKDVEGVYRSAVGHLEAASDEPPSISPKRTNAADKASATIEDQEADDGHLLQPKVLELDSPKSSRSTKDERDSPPPNAMEPSSPTTPLSNLAGSSNHSDPSREVSGDHGAVHGGARKRSLSTTAIQEDFHNIFALADDPLWSNRVKFFDTIAVMATGQRKNEVAQHWDKVMAAFLEHLKDNHYKVVLAALQTLMELLPLHMADLEPFFEPLLARLLHRQVDIKEVVRKLAGDAIDLLVRYTQPTAALIPSCLKVLDTNNPRVRCFCAELLQRLLQICEDYIANPSTMKMVMHKYLNVSTPSGRWPELERICNNGLYQLYQMNPNVFLAQATLLTPPEISEVKERLVSRIPNISEDLSKTRKRLASSPVASTCHDSNLPAPPQSNVPAKAATVAELVRRLSQTSSNENAAPKPQAPSPHHTASSRSQGDSPKVAQPQRHERSSPTAVSRDHPTVPPQRSISPVNFAHQFRSDADDCPRDVISPPPEPSTFCPVPVSASPSPVPPAPESGGQSPDVAPSPGIVDYADSPSWKSELPLANTYNPSAYRTIQCPASLYSSLVLPTSAAGPPLVPEVTALPVATSVPLNVSSAPAAVPRASSPPTPSAMVHEKQTLSYMIQQLVTDVDGVQRREALNALLVATSPEFRSTTPLGQFQWSLHFVDFLNVLLHCTRDSDVTVRSTALFVLQHLMAWQPNLFEEHLGALFPALLQSCQSPAREVVQRAEGLLLDMVITLNPSKAIDCIIKELSRDPLNVQVLLHLLSKVIPRLKPEEILQRAPLFMGPLYEGFKHRSAEVRKAVVFCLVDALLVLGDQFTDWLQPLNTSQRKLVAIYLQRQQQLGVQSLLNARQA